MLTIQQPVHYGYKSVHDLPTPPTTSRASPPLIYQETGQKVLSGFSRSNSPQSQPMSAPHRGLPPPAAMTLAQPPPPGAGHPPPPLAQHLSQAPPPPPPQSQALGQLPPPPPWQGQGAAAEESTRAWLMAKAEEEKRRQEEEKSRQESLKLEQRRIEHEILRTSLQGGIPPPMIPVVFAGMAGGNLPQAALEWAQQFMYAQAQQAGPPQLLAGQAPMSPEHRRESQSHVYGHPGPASASTSISSQQAQGSFVQGYPASPGRARGYSMPGRPTGGASSLPGMNPAAPLAPGSMSSNIGTAAGQPQQQQQEPQQSPSIYFHHWQPPSSQAGQSSSSHRPASPSGDSPPRKRKAQGPQTAAPPPGSLQRLRTPPPVHPSGPLNVSAARRRGHSRQRSDLGSYRPTGRSRPESMGALHRAMSPIPISGLETTREDEPPSASSSRQQHRSGAHSVSSLLSDDPSPQPSQYPPSSSVEARAPGQQSFGEGKQRDPPFSGDRSRGGASSHEHDAEGSSIS